MTQHATVNSRKRGDSLRSDVVIGVIVGVICVIAIYFASVELEKLFADGRYDAGAAVSMGAQDDGAVTHHPEHRETAFARGDALGAKTWRIIARADRPWELYADAIAAARQHGYRVHLTLTAEKDPLRFASWAGRIAAKVRGQVYSIGVYNEPEVGGISPCEYRTMFMRSYKLIRRAAPKMRVLWGELSPHRPLTYTEESLQCGKTPVKAQGFAWHPYCGSDPMAPCKTTSGGQRWIGPGDTNQVKRFLKRLRSRIQTEGRLPLTPSWTEFGFDRRDDSIWGTSDATADRYWPRALAMAARHNVALVVAYQMLPTTGSGWDTYVSEDAAAAIRVLHP